MLSERPRVYVKTFGCQMNEYDSQKLLKILEPQYSEAQSLESADLIIINTCSVRDKPEHKLYSYLGEMAELKSRKTDLLIGVGGCVAQQEGQRITKRSRAVDFVFGTHNLSLVPALISRRLASGLAQVAVDYRDEWEELPLGFAGNEGKISTFVSISRGCNKNCTYCIVPLTRGKEVSRCLDEVLREVRIAVHRGTREIVLLGQTVNSYGRDLQPKQSFASLLAQVAAVPGVMRIRFTSPHPQEVREDFFTLIAENPVICRHIHMPLQSGSDRILKAMKRNYRRDRYLRIIEELKSRVPDISITSDIIVGFPGESEEDFLQTLEVMNKVEFDSSYSFMFSPRPGTKAAELPGQLPEEEKLRRLKFLQDKQNEITTRKLNGWIGTEVEVLLDGKTKYAGNSLAGRISQNIMVNLVDKTESLKPGDLIMAAVTESARYSLRGSFVRIVDTTRLKV